MSARKFYTQVITALGLCLVVYANVVAATASSPCVPSGYLVGFFNGVFNTHLMAVNSLEAIKMKDLSTEANHEQIDYELFYNASGLDRNGATRLEDVVEAFSQRVGEQEASIKERYELFWEIITGHTGANSIWSRVSATLASAANLLTSLENYFVNEAAKALINVVSSPPTLSNYEEHRRIIDSYISQHKKVVLVAHSQGNLFMNEVYKYAIKANPSLPLKVVHIAPASANMYGEYTLADLDLVINAVRLTGPVPSNNVLLPRPNLRPEAVDWSGHMLVETYLTETLPPHDSVEKELKAAVSSVQVAAQANAVCASGPVATSTGEPQVSMDLKMESFTYPVNSSGVGGGNGARFSATYSCSNCQNVEKMYIYTECSATFTILNSGKKETASFPFEFDVVPSGPNSSGPMLGYPNNVATFEYGLSGAALSLSCSSKKAYYFNGKYNFI